MSVLVPTSPLHRFEDEGVSYHPLQCNIASNARVHQRSTRICLVDLANIIAASPSKIMERRGPNDSPFNQRARKPRIMPTILPASTPTLPPLPMSSDNDSPSPTSKPVLQRRDANRPRPRSQRAGSPKRRKRRSLTQSTSNRSEETFVEPPCDPHYSLLRHNFDTMRCFKRRCFVVDGHVALRGFIRRNECLLQGRRVVPGIIALCASYYVDAEAGIFQIGYKLLRFLKKAKKPSITMKMTKAVLVSIIPSKLNHTVIAAEVSPKMLFAELLRCGYLEPISSGQSGGDSVAYRIPMAKLLEFSYYKK